MNKILIINAPLTEEEMLTKAIEGEAQWLEGAEFDDISTEEADIQEAVEVYEEIIRMTEFD
ncbi:MAG: hypothetical protein IJ045_03430 [Ruminiclostridium sp.]|nr:hypothetical protein [Ruminiclostridium sp.]